MSRTMPIHAPQPAWPHRGLVVLAMALVICAAGVPGLARPHAGADDGDPATGAAVSSLPADATVLHVDGNPDEQVTEEPDGSPSRPYPNIAWAVGHAQYLRLHGQPVKILVAPGTYRESLAIRAVGDDPPLVIESAVPGEAIISGADVETRWEQIPGTDRFRAPWDEDWGSTPVPTGWENVRLPDGVRRREAVLVDGAPLRQVLSGTALEPGTFWVDEAANQLVVHPRGGGALHEREVEVARRPQALRILAQAARVTVRGFTFEATATPLTQHMVTVANSTDVLLEGNTFRHSSWGGLSVCCTDRVTVRHNRAAHNGGNGIDTNRAHDAVVEGNTITDNNVRGRQHGYTGWSVAGSKNLRLHDAVFRDNVYTQNGSRGLWFDTDVKNVLVEGERSCDNLRDGMFVEAVQGPLVVRDSVFCDNPGGGILVGTSGNITIEDSTLAGNGTGQLIFSGVRQRTWSDHVTGETITMGDFENWSLIRTTLRSSDATPLIFSPVISPDEWGGLLGAGELVTRDGTWTHPTPEEAIRIQAAHLTLGSLVEDLLGPDDEPTSDGEASSDEDGASDASDTSCDAISSGAGPFSDVSASHTFCAEIAWMAEQSISEGYDDGTFRPRAQVTRGAMAAFMSRLEQADPEPCTTAPFSDVPASHTFCAEIAWMAQQSISEGYDDGTFRPRAQVTRGAMAAFMSRLEQVR